ncbi:hypothetical protein KY385_03015 [Candidatus Parcubacteria bacterium]|nr:hypothetical protein [Candidatus Parcubacteria bacterium]
MIAVHHFSGLELPVYSPETVVVNRGNFEAQATRASESTFIRPAYLEIDEDRHGSLKGVIDTTNEDLEVIANGCGALVVGHQFGLYKIDGSNLKTYERYIPRRLPRQFFPRGYILVAEVEIVRDSAPVNALPDELSTPFVERILKGVDSYRLGKDYGLWDIGPDQFLAPTEDLSSSLWLVDIEPRFDRFR